MTNLWKDVVGYEDLYQVSKRGQVRRKKSKRLLKPKPTTRGYRSVQLYRNAHAKDRFIHHLVLEAFTGQRPPGHECNHLNGIKHQNDLVNLEWCTRSKNQLHRHTLFSNSLMAPNSKWWLITSPHNESFRIKGLRNFCKRYGLPYTSFYELAAGKCKSASWKGWRCQYDEKT